MYISSYITTSQNKLIFQYLPNANSPSFTNLWTRIQTMCSELAENNNKNQSGMIGKDLEIFKYYSVVNKFNYWCLRSRGIESEGIHSLEPFFFLEKMDQLLLEYFDKERISIQKIVNNYDRVTLIFNCCMNGGELAIGGMYSNRIKDIIPDKQDLSKVINSTTQNFQYMMKQKNQNQNRGGLNLTAGTSAQSDNDAIPWRSNKTVNTSRDELFLDLKERLNVTISKSKDRRKRFMEVVNGYIIGSIQIRNYLKPSNNIPLIKLELDFNGNDIGIPSFHDCIEKDRENNNIITSNNNSIYKFIPPNGKFQLMNYCMDVTDLNSTGLIDVAFQNHLGIKNDEFEISLTIRSHKNVTKINNLVLSLNFTTSTTNYNTNNNNNNNNGSSNSNSNSTTTSSRCSSTSISHNDKNNTHKIRILNNTHGRYTTTSNSNTKSLTGQWIFDSSISTGTMPILRGCIETHSNTNNDNTNNMNTSKLPTLENITMNYTLEGISMSGINVKSIEVVNPNNLNMSNMAKIKQQQPFKGVKYVSEISDYVLRGLGG